MNPERYRRACELLARAFELPPGERPGYIRAECGDDAELFLEASSLLSYAVDGETDNPASRFALSPVVEPEEALNGTRVGRFQVIDELGRGGMGIVWRAHDPVLNRPVAIKFLPAPLARSPIARERFLSEARAASALDHANVATIYDFGEAEGKSFIALRLVEGQTVARHRTRGPLPATTALRVAVDVAHALQHAHDRGVLHRDVSANNIMITPDGRGVLLDFGLAASAGAARGATRRGGTPNYVAPEVLTGAAPDERSDVFALGVVLYEMLTGQFPFPPSAASDATASSPQPQLAGPPKPPGVLIPGLPASADSAVLGAIDPDPLRRPRTAGEFAAELESVLLDVTHPGRTRKRRRTIAYTALGAVLLSTVAYIASRDRAPAPVSNPVLAVWNTSGTDSVRATTLNALLQTGFAENSPCRVISAQHVTAIRKRGEARGRHDAIELAREAGASLILTSEVLNAGSTPVVDWRLTETAHRRALKQGQLSVADLTVAADSVISMTVPDIAAHSGTRPPVPRRLATMTTSSAEAYELYARGQRLYLENRYSEAAAALKAALDIDSTFALASYEMSEVLEELPDPKAARAHADLAWRHRERLSLRDRMRVEAFREKLLWNVPTAMKTYEEILQRWPDDHDALAEMSRAKWWFWYWSEGLEYAQRGLALYPDDLFFLEMVSGGLVVTGRSEESLPVARRRIAIDNSYDAWDNLSYAFLTLGELDSAMVAQEEGMRVDPNPLAFEEAKVQIASATGDLERTIELVEARAENGALSPRKRYSARVNEHNGVMGYYLLAGRYRDAMALLQEANRRETDVDGVRRDVNMCNLLSLLGRHEEALAYITRCRLSDTWTRDPNSSKYDRPDGEINSLIALGRFDEVRALLNGKTEAVLPGPHQFRLARLALAEQHPEQALEHLERAVQYGVIWGWMDIDYHVMRAEAFQQARRPEDAEVELREVIRKYPIYKVAHYHLARILDERSAAQDAATEYRTFLEAWPRADQDLTEVVTARERLAALVDGR